MRNGRLLITIAAENMTSEASDALPHSSAPVFLGSTPQETAPVVEPQVDEARGGKGVLSLTITATGDRALETTGELGDTSPPDTFPEFVLREKSRACKRRFKECLYILNLPHDDWLEQRSAEFNWWASGLNADKNGPGSLDARLRLRPDVTAVIVDALDGLEDALYMYHELATSDHPLSDEEDSPGLTVADDDSAASDGVDRAPSPWSDMSSGSRGGPASAVGDGEEEDEETEDAENQREDVHSPLSSDTYAEQRVYIENNLEVLIRIHTAIKLSGLKLRNKRADDALRQAEQEYQRQKLTLGAHKALAGQDGEHERFRRYLAKLVLRNGYTEDLMRGLSFRIYQLAEAERCQDVRERRDLEDSQDPERSQEAGESDGGQIRESYDMLLQKKLLVVLRAYLCDPARLTTVQRRLIDANIVRRNRLVHAGSASKTPSHARQGRSQPAPQRSSLMAGNITPSSSNLMPSPASQPPATRSKQGAQATKSFVAQPCTALESKFSITGALTPALRSTARSAGTKMSARVGHLDYPSCPMKKDGPFPCDYCPMILPQDYQKKDKWRGHVAQDLCGYVCVFEDCESPEDMFASTYEWMSHMARSHSEVEWVCPLCAKHRLSDAADDGQAASFPDPSQLKDHILACHPATDATADLTELELVSAGQRTVGIRKVRCPLCRPGLVTSEEDIDGSAVPPLPLGQAAGLVRLEEDQHVATHIHEFALHAFPSADGEEPEEAKSLPSEPSTRVDIKFEGPRIPEGSLQGQALAYTLENIQGVIEELKATFLQVQASGWIQAESSVRLDAMAARLDDLIPTQQLAQGEVDLDGFAWGLNESLVLVSQLCYISPNEDEEGPQIIELLEELDESLRLLPSLFETGRRREEQEPVKGKKEKEEEEEEADTQDCLKSLAFLHMEDRSTEVGWAARGTCKWLFQHPTYKTWTASDRGLLWIKGKPSSGKSTLLKYALGNTQEARDSALVLSFFFHGRGDELQRTPLGLFRSLLHQILSQAPDALQDLVDMFRTKRTLYGKPGEDWHWHEAELRYLFELSLPNVLQTRPVWLFVDALDECGEQNAVKLVETFTSLLQSLPSKIGLGQFRICFSCRHYPVLDLDKSTLEICTEDENYEDISTFVNDNLSSFGAERSSTISALITERAAGVFMWARLVVEQVVELELDGSGLKTIEAAILSIPSDLDALYQQLIQSMDRTSIKLVQWICFAIRPLSIDELPWAMAIDANCPHRSLRTCQEAEDYVSDRDRIKRQVLTLSRGLAEVSQTHVVQFIHQSVKDFFVEKGLLALDGSATSTEAAGRAHFQFSKICIRYLAMEEVSQATSHEGEQFSFLRYATTSWVAHTKQWDARSISRADQEDILVLLNWPSNACIELWVRIYETVDRDSDDRPSHGTRLIHVVSRYGMAGLLTAALQKAGCVIGDLDAKDRDGRTPLLWAAANGHEAVVRLLLDTGKVDIDAKDTFGWTPLSWAAKKGHETVVRLLLDTGKVDIDAKDNFGWTPMLWAAANGHETVVRLLLDTGKVDADAKDDDGRTPLLWAAANGHEAVVRLLLDTGKVDVNAKENSGRTPLLWAAANGHKAVVRLLLDTGKVDIDAKYNFGRTPLLWAAENGYEAVVRLLLDTGKVDVDAKDEDGQTPLSWAAEKGHETVVRLLLDTGKVDVDAKDNFDRTPLLWAAANGHETVVRLLLDTGKVDVDAKDEDGQTPLSLAAANGYATVVNLLQ